MTFMMSQANDKNNVDRKGKTPKKTMAKPTKALMIDQHSTSIAKQTIAKKPQKPMRKAPDTPKPKNVVKKDLSMGVHPPSMLPKASFR